MLRKAGLWKWGERPWEEDAPILSHLALKRPSKVCPGLLFGVLTNHSIQSAHHHLEGSWKDRRIGEPAPSPRCSTTFPGVGVPASKRPRTRVGAWSGSDSLLQSREKQSSWHCAAWVSAGRWRGGEVAGAQRARGMKDSNAWIRRSHRTEREGQGASSEEEE